MKIKKSSVNCFKKRELLNRDKIDSQVLINYGLRCLESEHFNDAIDFFEKAKHTDGILKVRELAIQSGDYFLYKRCSRILREKEKREELYELAEKAISSGKIYFASQVYETLGETGKAKKLISKLEDR